MLTTKMIAINVEALLCIFAGGIFAYLFLILRIERAIPPRFVEAFTEAINQRRFKEAFDMARSDSSFLAKVLVNGMARLQFGIEEGRRISSRAAEVYSQNYKTLSTYLPTVSTIAAMIGVFGGQSADANDPIATWKLILAVALIIPSMLGHAFLMNRITSLFFEVDMVSDDLLTQMYHNSKKTPSTK
jgi:biopolymer transport protein ExbB